MALTKARRHQLIVVWSVIALAVTASVGLGIVLMEDSAAMAVGVAAATALGIGLHLTRRILTPHRRASITVGELRGRRAVRR